MPLVRVSDEVYQHLKNSSRDGESIDATIRRIAKLSTINAYRKYADREKLIPLEAYRWMILSAYIPRGENAKLTRADLQRHVEHLLEHHKLDEVFPADFALTPSSSSPRTRWKARFANIVGRLEESEVLHLVGDGTGKKALILDPVYHHELLYAGLHIDRENSTCHFTQLPEYVTSTNWTSNWPFTVDEQVHPPIANAEDGEARYERLQFLFNQRDYKALLKEWTNAIGDVKKMRLPWIVPDAEALETVGNSLTKEDWQRVLEGLKRRSK